jgi:rRNA-processing protein FCF1
MGKKLHAAPTRTEEKPHARGSKLPGGSRKPGRASTKFSKHGRRDVVDGLALTRPQKKKSLTPPKVKSHPLSKEDERQLKERPSKRAGWSSHEHVLRFSAGYRAKATGRSYTLVELQKMWSHPGWKKPVDLVREGFAYSPTGAIWYVKQGQVDLEVGYQSHGSLLEEVHFEEDRDHTLEFGYLLEQGTHDDPNWGPEERLVEERLDRLRQAQIDGHGNADELFWLQQYSPLHLREAVNDCADVFDATIQQRAGELSSRKPYNTHQHRKELLTVEEVDKLIAQKKEEKRTEDARPTCAEVWLNVTQCVSRELVGFSRDATAAMRAANLARQTIATYELTPEEHQSFNTVKLIEMCASDALVVTSNDRHLIAPILDKDFQEKKRLYRFYTKRCFTVLAAPNVWAIIVTLAFSMLFASMATSPIAVWIFQRAWMLIARGLMSSIPGASWVTPYLSGVVSFLVRAMLPKGMVVETAIVIGLVLCWRKGWFGTRQERSLDE